MSLPIKNVDLDVKAYFICCKFNSANVIHGSTTSLRTHIVLSPLGTRKKTYRKASGMCLFGGGLTESKTLYGLLAIS